MKAILHFIIPITKDPRILFSQMSITVVAKWHYQTLFSFNAARL